MVNLFKSASFLNYYRFSPPPPPQTNPKSWISTIFFSSLHSGKKKKRSLTGSGGQRSRASPFQSHVFPRPPNFFIASSPLVSNLFRFLFHSKLPLCSSASAKARLIATPSSFYPILSCLLPQTSFYFFLASHGSHACGPVRWQRLPRELRALPPQLHVPGSFCVFIANDRTLHQAA